MSWIYCGTAQQVNAANTQALLSGDYNAIWCPPPGMQDWPNPHPAPGDPLWLIWREDAGTPVFLLGGGIIIASPGYPFGTTILWTNSDAHGIRDHAQNLGYTGPTNMAFLRLNNVVLPDGDKPLPLGPLEGIRSGFNKAAAYEALLKKHIRLR